MSGLCTPLAAIAAARIWSPHFRGRLLRMAGVRTEGARVYSGIRFTGSPQWLTIGRGSFINAELLVGANAPVRIGADVAVGPRCALLPTTHEIGPHAKRAGAVTAAEIVIGDGCWLGAGVIVLGGVRIGAGAVIAAGALVTGDCEGDALYAGVPARFVKALPS